MGKAFRYARPRERLAKRRVSWDALAHKGSVESICERGTQFFAELSCLCSLEGFDLTAVVAYDDADAGALRKRRQDLAGEAEHRGLVRRTVADHEGAAAVGHYVEDAAERAARKQAIVWVARWAPVETAR